MARGQSRMVALALACVLAATGPGKAQPGTTDDRPVVTTQDQLPRHEYRLATSATALFDSDDATFNAFARKVEADIVATLANYRIEDAATRRRLLASRLAIELLTGRNQQALQTADEVRALEQKPDAKLLSGKREEAVARARIATGANSGAAYEAAFAKEYRAAIEALPFAVVQTRLKEAKSSFETNTPPVLRGVIENDFESEVRTRGAIGDDGAGFLIRARLADKVYWPVHRQAIDALRTVLAANTVVKPDIWAAREITFGPRDRLTPVAVAIWDTGVDPALFPGHMLTNAIGGSKGAGSLYGLAFDPESRPTRGALRPLTAERKAAYDATVSALQGWEDMGASLDTPDADALRAKIATLTPTESAAFIESLDFVSDYVHGSHVAGIVERGNPAIRMGIIRETFYDGPNAPPTTEQSVANSVAAFAAVARWIAANRIRVVNMSWIGTPRSIEAGLERNNVGKDAAERKALARRYFDRQRTAFEQVLAANPATLFVSGAGNSNADNAFEEGYPSSIVAPNLIVANAVDQAGDETDFTSNGRNVVVSANGYQVVSPVPGGRRIKKSGTSMAAPNVANLAAKLIAVNPRLTPMQVIALIRTGADASTDGRRHLINPRKSLALLRTGRF